MNKESKKKEDKPKKNNLKSFLKKRAPFYLAAIALIVITAQGILSEKSFESSLPELSNEEQKIVDILMKYDGGNGGYTMMNAITDQIEDEYKDEKVFDHKKTIIELNVNNVNSGDYQVILNFKSHKGEMNFDWKVNSETKEITSDNTESKYLIDKVNFYD